MTTPSFARHRFLTAALLLAASCAAACGDGGAGPTADDFPDEPAPDPQPAVVAFVDVAILPMTGDHAVFDQTVVVEGDEIVEIGPTGSTHVPEGAFRIEGRGRFLAPGLADMHVHTTADTFQELRNDFVLWLANGVTTIRVMWGGTGTLAARDNVAAGEWLGPRLLVASPGVDGPGGPWEQFTPSVGDAEEARARVAEHAASGYDFIKVYNSLSVASYDAIVAEAAAQGLGVVGHVPSRVGIERVQDAGQRTLEHFIGVKYEAASAFTGGTVDTDRARAVLTRSAAAGVWHTPTITVDALSRSRSDEIRGSQELRYVSPGMLDFFETGFYHGFPDDVASREAAGHRSLIALAHEVGARLLIGTDAGFGWILPGYSIHDELSSFVEAGLKPYDALHAATIGAAEAGARAGDFGGVREGMKADLVLLARNPLVDIGAYRESSGTMVRGRWLSRGTLRGMLEEIRAGYGN